METDPTEIPLNFATYLDHCKNLKNIKDLGPFFNNNTHKILCIPRSRSITVTVSGRPGKEIQDGFFCRFAGQSALTGLATVHWIVCINAIKLFWGV